MAEALAVLEAKIKQLERKLDDLELSQDIVRTSTGQRMAGRQKLRGLTVDMGGGQEVEFDFSKAGRFNKPTDYTVAIINAEGDSPASYDITRVSGTKIKVKSSESADNHILHVDITEIPKAGR